MLVYIPQINSLRDRICRRMHKEAVPMTATALRDAFPGNRAYRITAALTEMRDIGAVEFRQGYWRLSEELTRYYDQCEPMNEEVPADVAAGKYVKPFQPLKSLPWAQHLDKLRDISFHTASGAFQPLGYRA